MDNKKEHLPVFGVGPMYVYVTAVLTAIAIFLSTKRIIYVGLFDFLKLLFTVIGILFIVLGVFMWIKSVIIDKLDKNIKENKLLVTGIYAWVRNPIYSAFSFAFSGVLMLFHDAWLLLLPLVFWVFLTALMKQTEEKWLLKLYGKEYSDYCRRVNRCIPWFPKNKDL